MTRSSEALPSSAYDVKAETLVRRARELAQSDAEHLARDTVDILLFRLGSERYAVQLRLLRSVLAPMGLTAVPCAPPQVAGIVNVRGEVVTVIDLGTVVGPAGSVAHSAPDQPGSSERWVILVQVPQGTVGLLVDEVLGMGQIAHEELDRSISGRDFVAGIYEGTTILLDLTVLLTPERLDVFEPVT